MSAKAKLRAAEALRLAESVSTVIVVKGTNVVRFSMGKDRPDDATLLAPMLGPTGRLRAPTIRKGTTLIVGLDDEAYGTLL